MPDYRTRAFRELNMVSVSAPIGMVENGTRLTAGLRTEGRLHCRSHSCKQRTKPELGFIHGRRWRTKATAESNDMPRFRMRYAITIAAERETPCTKENKNSQYYEPHADQSLEMTMKAVEGRRKAKQGHTYLLTMDEDVAAPAQCRVNVFDSVFEMGSKILTLGI